MKNAGLNSSRRLPVRLRYIVLPVVFLAVVALVASVLPEEDAAASLSVAADTVDAETALAEFQMFQPHDMNLTPQMMDAVLNIEPAAGDATQDTGIKVQPTAFSSSARVYKAETITVGKGDTMMKLLQRAKIDHAVAYDAIEKLRKVYDPRDIRAGQTIRVIFSHQQDGQNRRFEGLRLDPNVISSIMVKRDKAGVFQATKKEKDVKRRQSAARGSIDSSLYVAGSRQGMPNHILLDLIRIYSWSVDFQRDIKSGDEFEVMYEEYVTEDGVKTGKGEILYATLSLGGKPHTLYRYKMKDGTVDYFGPNGASAKKALMKTPIDGARLSSGFGLRKHPVLGYNKMHKGVDFAAATGTPIYAAGDGVIEKRGRNGGYGNYVRVRHRHGLHTAYAHMSRFKSGQGIGTRVKQGEVIGYVGTTGRSTGPHLHYEVLMNGRQVNPRTINMPTGIALEGEELENFFSVVQQASVDFEKLGMGGVRLAVNTAIPERKPEEPLGMGGL